MRTSDRYTGERSTLRFAARADAGASVVACPLTDPLP
jgi:hypothetical protein